MVKNKSTIIALLILLILVTGCLIYLIITNIQDGWEEDPKAKCENVGGKWVKYHDCCCKKECLDMTFDEMHENYHLCECCLIK